MIKKGMGAFLFSLCLIGCSSNPNQAPPDLNMVISVSSDGHYAIATNTNKQAVLWDLQNHSYKIVFKDANIYSAYFIKNTNDFMYQNDATNEVVIEDINGNIIKTFNPGIATFGEVITSDLDNYFGAGVTLSLYKIHISNNEKTVINQSWCLQDHNGEKYSGSATSECIDFRGSNQLLNLQFTPDQKTLVGSNFGYLFIWNVTTGKGTQIQKTDAQTTVSIDPTGSYVVTGDVTAQGYSYSLASSSQPQDLFAYTTPENSETSQYFNNRNQNFLNEIVAIRFIDDQNILVIFNGSTDPFYFATLYNPNNIVPINYTGIKRGLTPIKYLLLTENAESNFNLSTSKPLVSDDFNRDQAIDTSPSAHILVMSMAKKNGIIVYKYDPATQTLKREWAGEVKPWWEFW